MTSIANTLNEDIEKLRQSFDSLPPPQIKPSFVIVSGLPGSGKSFFCHRLAENLPSLILSNAALRRLLFPYPRYNESENKRLFPACHALIEEFLTKGIPTIFDATNLMERNREHFLSYR